jgi:menaquinone-9 beta-reductase
MPARHDVVILGGGLAGCAAALTARRAGLTTLVIERAGPPRTSPCGGWLGPAAVQVCREFGVDPARAGAEFTGVKLWPGDFARSVEVGELNGYVVEPALLARALLTAAQKAGADVVTQAAATEMQLRDGGVHLHLATGKTVEAGVLLIADGWPSTGAQLARFPAAQSDAAGGSAATATLPAKKAGRGLEIVLCAGRCVRLATIVRADSKIQVTLHTSDRSSPASAQLRALLAAGQAGGALPAVAAGEPAVVPALGGVALDMDSHVGKRCLLIGDAGGFVSAFAQEGAYPALRSGVLAAETAARALKAPVLQDELASFSACWRAALADYLRMPNTDLGLLLPMVFSNAQMSRRLARAFLMGQPF